MPIYSFQCEKCGNVQDLNKKISDRDETASITCPECSETGQIKRLLSAPMVAYSVTVNGGYGSSKHHSGFKEVLNRIHDRAPGSRLDKTSSYF